MTDLTWLQTLKAGDEVVMQHGSSSPYTISVTKVTPASVVVGTVKFSKRTGREIGGGPWHFAHIMPVTPERVTLIAVDRARHFLASLSATEWRRIAEDQILKIAADVKAALESK